MEVRRKIALGCGTGGVVTNTERLRLSEEQGYQIRIVVSRKISDELLEGYLTTSSKKEAP